MSPRQFARITGAPVPVQAQICVAEIGVALWPLGGGRRKLVLPASHTPFLGQCNPDLSLAYQYGAIPEHLLVGEVVFDESTLWSLHRNQHGLVWRQMSASAAAEPQRLVLLDPDFREGIVYFIATRGDDGLLEYPIPDPLEKFLFDSLLSRGRGVTLHACGLVDHGHGLLFVGESGAGKSTMAELWHGRGGATVLNDERTILRPQGQRWRIYGTPWHGTAGLFSPASAPLAAIFFLQQAGSNRLAEVGPAEAARRLLVCAFLPFWFRAGLEYALDCLARVSQAVPCYELGFEAEGSVVDFVRRLG